MLKIVCNLGFNEKLTSKIKNLNEMSVLIYELVLQMGMQVPFVHAVACVRSAIIFRTQKVATILLLAWENP